MGFRELYSDKKLLKSKEHVLPYTLPIISSEDRAIGAFKYLKGIDWKLIDNFKHLHGEINANLLMIWGEDDRTFPMELGREMMNQFTCKRKFVPIEKASLLPHEERPKEVVEAILDFILERD